MRRTASRSAESPGSFCGAIRTTAHKSHIMRAVSWESTDQVSLPDGSGHHGDGRGGTHRCAEAAWTGAKTGVVYTRPAADRRRYDGRLPMRWLVLTLAAVLALPATA